MLLPTPSESCETFSMANFTPKNHRTRNLEAAANAAKVLFLVIGIGSTAFLTARFALPYLLGLLSSSLPKLRTHAISWLSPPYLFITVHFIIMVIWKLHRGQNPQDDVAAAAAADPRNNPPVDIDDAAGPVVGNDAGVPPAGESSQESSRPRPSEAADKERGAGQQLPWPPPEPEPKDIPEDDGLDATWQAIMSGRSTPPVRSQLKKSDTWEKTGGGLPGSDEVDARDFKNSDDTTFGQKRDGGGGGAGGVSSNEQARALARSTGGAAGAQRFRKSDTFRQVKRDGGGDPVPTEKREMRKSKTFRESTAGAGAGGGWRGRDVLVVGRDELFGRVEAFIKMNYEQMRLQRQESDQQRFVAEMVNATAY